MKKLFPLLALTFFSLLLNAQRGKNGDKTVASQLIVNEYTALAADAAAGQSAITVTSNGLNTNNRFTGPLAVGDLLLIIQMQGATIATPDAAGYGAITNYNNAGNCEFAEVASVSGAQQITLACGLQNSYTAAGHVQVVRVQRYNTLTVNSSASVTCPQWDGTTGGIVALEVLGNTTIAANGKITATGKGFRGGLSNENESTYGVTGYTSTLSAYGAEKGESIAGSVTDYDNMNGRYSRGAPANGGGGGNGHNAGGGGGANGGDPLQWTGKGLPDNGNNGAYSQAWELEQVGLSTATSHGGGQGGYTFSANDQNALTTPLYTSAWGGDWRDPVGGVGGHPLDNTTGRLYFGGGGGAGDQNDNTAGDGGNGGGLVYLTGFGTVTGGGIIEASGANGQNSGGGLTEGNDGGGGGGGGGTIVVKTPGTLSNLTLTANGGTGGSQLQLFGTDAYGTGGGGGGGYIATSANTVTVQVAGGANGTSNSPSLFEFPPNGATRGFAGVTTYPVPTYDITAVGDTVCNGQQALLTAAITGTPPQGYQVEWYDTTNGFAVLGTGLSLNYTFTQPQTIFVHTCPGSFSVPVQLVGGTAPLAGFTYVDNGSYQATFTNTSANGTSYLWNFGNNNTSTDENPVFTFMSDGTYPVTLIASNACGSDTVTINVVVEKTGILENSATALQIVQGTDVGQFYIKPGTSACGQFDVMVTDLSGRTLQQNRITYGGSGLAGPVNLGNVAPGLYMLTFTCQNRLYYAKLVVSN